MAILEWLQASMTSSAYYSLSYDNELFRAHLDLLVHIAKVKKMR
jgi:hypothetical protein